MLEQAMFRFTFHFVCLEFPPASAVAAAGGGGVVAVVVVVVVAAVASVAAACVRSQRPCKSFLTCARLRSPAFTYAPIMLATTRLQL